MPSMGSPSRRDPLSSTANAVNNGPDEYLTPQVHYGQPAYLDVTDDTHPAGSQQSPYLFKYNTMQNRFLVQIIGIVINGAT